MFAYFAGLCIVRCTVAAAMFGSKSNEKLLQHIQSLADIVYGNDVDILSVIEDEIKFIEPNAIIFDKNAFAAPSEYKFDESVDCVFHLFDIMEERRLQPNVASKLRLTKDEDTNRKLFKAIESGIYLLCKPEDKYIGSEDKIDGFYEWISMEPKDKRQDIERTITKKMKSAFKLTLSEKEKNKVEKDKIGQFLYKKCLKKLKPNRIKDLYQKLRTKYPKQRYFMDMIPSIFMYSCSRSYATSEWIKEFMQILVTMDDADLFFNFMADEMKTHLDKSKDNDECIQNAQADDLTHKMEKHLFKTHTDFKQYPVYNAINGLIELGCARKFLFDDDSMPNMNDIPNAPHYSQHSEL